MGELPKENDGVISMIEKMLLCDDSYIQNYLKENSFHKKAASTLDNIGLPPITDDIFEAVDFVFWMSYLSEKYLLEYAYEVTTKRNVKDEVFREKLRQMSFGQKLSHLEQSNYIKSDSFFLYLL